MEFIEEIRSVKGDELLTRTENQLYRKFTGKISWLAANTHPDLAITALQMSKKNASAMIKDLKKIDKVIEKIRDNPCKVEFTKVTEKEDLMLLGVTDA